MEVYRYRKEMNDEVKRLKSQGRAVGLVPTMGALHRGHLELVDCSLKANDYTVVSIFVNPTQFDRQEDLGNYPRMLEEDISTLKKMGVQAVFAPETREMYPEPDNRQFDFGGLDKVMEGRYRKGHFNGVAQIVSKLFMTIEPDRAYFGRKDFQQLVIIKKLVKQLSLSVEIVGCPIVREKDGLALSSRNLRLTSEQRKHAPKIYQTLKQAASMKHNKNVDALKQWVTGRIDEDPFLETEYFDIVREDNLQPVKNWQKGNNLIGCIAVYCGEIRLIDNMKF